ncbi:hypothetical protein XENOCAPTIV_021020 [Xenoophorus captivus]|uniref:Uncharacterized protein n=1 Tax=Xenoophorus captivus TaxID=1517983 RepID=A0ABV0RDD6_9TELE
MRAQYGLMPPPLLASSSPSRRMFSRPFRATWTILESITVSRSHKGFIQPRHFILCYKPIAPGGGVGNSPRCLLPCAKLRYLQNTDERRHKVCIYHHL